MNTVLIIHIIAGTVSLAAGYLALFARKGATNHRKAGKVFVWSMIIVGVSALALSLSKSITFLTLIALFSLYQVIGGRRALALKNSRSGIFDFVWIVFGLINASLMIGQWNIVLGVFGGIQAVIAIQDLIFHIKNRKGHESGTNIWLIRHLGLMTGALIASSTAFVVVNINFVEPAWIPWLAPTFILSPVIAIYTRKYTKKVQL